MPTPSFVTSANGSEVLNNPESTSETGSATQPTAFIYETNSVTGNDVLEFRKYDTLLTSEPLYDNNADGQIRFSKHNGVLSSDQTAVDEFNQGDTIQFTTVSSFYGLRTLGTRQGYTVYADYTVKSALFDQGSVIEGTVNSEFVNGTAGTAKELFFYDTALGINLGKDTIRNFGTNDELVLTSKFFDSNDDGQIRYGKDKLFHLPDFAGNAIGDTSADLGGTVAIFNDAGSRVSALYLTETETINGVTYYHYSSTPTASA